MAETYSRSNITSSTRGSSSSIVSSTTVAGNESDSVSEATIHGGNGILDIDGDKVEVTDGMVSVNGASYGAIHKDDVVTYQARGKTKTLLINGVERKPY